MNQEEQFLQDLYETIIVVSSDAPFPDRIERRLIETTDRPFWMHDLNGVGVAVAPMWILFGEDKEYEEDIDIDIEGFYGILEAYHKKTGKLPSTSQTNPHRFLQIYQQFPDKDILVLPITSEHSGTFENAITASEQLAEDEGQQRVSVLDSRTLSSGITYLALEAARLIREGKTIDEIYRELEGKRDDQIKLYAHIPSDNLHYLSSGGRISNAAALLGGIIKMHPFLTVVDGLVTQAGRIRERSGKYEKRFGYLFDRLERDVENWRESGNDISTISLYVHHTEEPETAEKLHGYLVERVGEELGLDVFSLGIKDFGPVLARHAGPGIWGYSFVPWKVEC